MAIQKISSTVIGPGAVTSEQIATGAITAADIPDGEITNAKIDTVAASKVTGEISTSQIADTAVTNAKIDTVASTKVTGRVQDNEDLPNIRPSLLLDFANSKVLDPRITFTRSSTGTYWDGKTVAKAEENLLIHSQDFSNSVWQPNAYLVGITSNAALAPDGTTTADKATALNGNDSHFISNFFDYKNANETYTLSVYAKSVEYDYIKLFGANSSTSEVWFNISTGAIGSSAGPGLVSSNITDVGNGWYRCEITFTNPDTQARNTGFYPTPTDNVSNFAGDDTSGIYIWGAQLEQRSSVTAYTPTTSVPITKYQPVLQTASVNQPRFDHDPVTYKSKGLLIEEQRTNLYTSSKTLEASGSTVSNIILPDGSQNGGRIINRSAPFNFYHIGSSLNSETSVTASMFVKAGLGNGQIYFGFEQTGTRFLEDGRFLFDLVNGSIQTSRTYFTATLTGVGNGWYRISVTGTINVTGGPVVHIGNNGNDYENTVHAWGLQLEQGSFATSYIETNGSTVTRTPDRPSILTSTFGINQTEGTIYSEVDLNNVVRVAGGAAQRRHVWSLIPSTGSIQDGWLTVYYNETSFDVLSYGNTINDYLTNATSNFGVTKNASAYFDDGGLVDTFASIDGNAVAENSPGAISRNLTYHNLEIGYAINNSDRVLSGCIAKLAYYPKRLSNAQLQALTED